MNHLYKGKAKIISAWASVLLLLTITLYSNGNSFFNEHFHRYLTTDTIPKKPVGNDIRNDTAKQLRVIKPGPALKTANRSDTSIVTKIDTLQFKGSKDSPF